MKENNRTHDLRAKEICTVHLPLCSWLLSLCQLPGVSLCLCVFLFSYSKKLKYAVSFIIMLNTVIFEIYNKLYNQKYNLNRKKLIFVSVYCVAVQYLFLKCQTFQGSIYSKLILINCIYLPCMLKKQFKFPILFLTSQKIKK